MYGWQVGQGQAGCIGAGEGAVSDGDLERLYRDSVSVAGGAGLPDSYGYHNAAQYQQQYPQLQQQQQQQLYHSPVPPYPYPYPQPPTFAPAALPEIAAFPPQQQPQLDYSLQQLPTTYTTDMASFAEPQWSQPSSNWYPTAEPHPPPSTSLPSQHFPMPGYAPPTVPDHPYDYLQPLPLAPPLHPSQPAPRNPPAPRPPPAAPTPATSRRPTTLSPSPKISRPVNLKSLTTEEAEAVALAAAGRKGHLTEPTSPPSSSKRLGTLSGKGGRGGGSKKSLLELAPTCWECGIEVARLVLRGPDVERLVPRCRMACLSCAPAVVDRVGVEEGGEGEGEAIRARRSTSEQAEADEATYFDTLSAAVDMLEGVKLSDGVEQRSLLAHVDVPARDDGVKCDVCSAVVAVGSVSGSTPSSRAAKFSTEVICVRCDSLYRPCSDCGGGGGRLTPGRWRCRELFSGDRKTCSLPHFRSPALEELSFEVFRIADIPSDRIDEIEETCRTLFYEARMGAIARPEYLSRGDGLATSFAQVERGTFDAWSLLAPSLREDVEETKGLRRYVAIMSCVPRARQKVKYQGSSQPYGFYIVEHDLAHGVNFYAALTPYATTGVAFDSHWAFGAFVMRRIKADLIQTNAERSHGGLAPYPSITANYFLSAFKSDSRMTASIIRRGYKRLADHLAEYPDTDPMAFPPHRETHIPRAFSHCWQTWVLRIHGEDDYVDGPRTVPRRRGRGDGGHRSKGLA